MTDPTPLSPAAKAVLTAFGAHPIRAEHIAEDLVPALLVLRRGLEYGTNSAPSLPNWRAANANLDQRSPTTPP